MKKTVRRIWHAAGLRVVVDQPVQAAPTFDAHVSRIAEMMRALGVTRLVVEPAPCV